MSETAEPKPAAPGARGAGGTPGGLGTFFAGLALAVAGAYWILNQVTVYGSFQFFHFMGLGGGGGFGLTMVILLIGIAMLFFDGKSVAGWIVTGIGTVIILAAVLMNMTIAFQQTSLFNTLLMFGMLAAGLGMIARSLRSLPPA